MYCYHAYAGLCMQPPKPIKRPKTLVGPTGDEREDPYYWLRDDQRQNPEVIAHLKVWPLYSCGPL